MLISLGLEKGDKGTVGEQYSVLDVRWLLEAQFSTGPQCMGWAAGGSVRRVEYGLCAVLPARSTGILAAVARGVVLVENRSCQCLQGC